MRLSVLDTSPIVAGPTRLKGTAPDPGRAHPVAEPGRRWVLCVHRVRSRRDRRAHQRCRGRIAW